MNENKSIGPFKAVGLALNTVGTAAVVLDKSVKESGEAISTTLQSVNSLISAGREALELTTAGALEDLRTDNIVEDAHRRVRVAQANAEAARILATLEVPA